MSTASPIRLGIVGVGKIVRDQHLPAVAGNGAFRLAATASRNGSVEGVPSYGTIEAMLADAEVDAVSLCMPPQFRYEPARTAIGAGKHVFLEKPPGASISEVEDLARLAEAQGVTLFASWHSRYAPAVEAARENLAGTRLKSARIVWKEDVRRWHPNQDWIWQPGGLGVFDPGINALSIATHIFPAFRATRAELDFPANRSAPIGARIAFITGDGSPIDADFDWRQTGPQSWDIIADTDAGQMLLSGGGTRLAVDGRVLSEAPEAEYPELYARFASLVAQRRSDVDIAPLRHVADAFMLGRRVEVADFFD